MYEDAFEVAKLINLEDPILWLPTDKTMLVSISEPKALFYKGSKVLSKYINYNKKLLQKLENDEFNYNYILDTGITLKINTTPLYFNFLIGLFIGFFVSCLIIFFKNVLKNK
jgi:hypothetical protein